MPLKYLFVAEFVDGTVIAQTQEDKSELEPETRSRFFDVLEKQKTVPLSSFVLIGDGHRYGVDLRDGHFEVDGVPFHMSEREMVEYQIVFFRRHTHKFNAGTGAEVEHGVVYRFGWQCNEDGKNYQEVMQIN